MLKKPQDAFSILLEAPPGSHWDRHGAAEDQQQIGEAVKPRRAGLARPV
jgi:hypothetical protein